MPLRPSHRRSRPSAGALFPEGCSYRYCPRRGRRRTPFGDIAGERVPKHLLDELNKALIAPEDPVQEFQPGRATGLGIIFHGRQLHNQIALVMFLQAPRPQIQGPVKALAVQCLSEVGHPTQVTGTVRKVLRTACALFDYCMIARPELKDFLIEHVVPYLEQFGRRCSALDGGERFTFGDEIADWLA